MVMSLLTRLQTHGTERFAGLFGYSVLYVLAVDVEGVTPEFVVGTVEAAQSGCVAGWLAGWLVGWRGAD